MFIVSWWAYEQLHWLATCSRPKDNMFTHQSRVSKPISIMNEGSRYQPLVLKIIIMSDWLTCEFQIWSFVYEYSVCLQLSQLGCEWTESQVELKVMISMVEWYSAGMLFVWCWMRRMEVGMIFEANCQLWDNPSPIFHSCLGRNTPPPHTHTHHTCVCTLTYLHSGNTPFA